MIDRLQCPTTFRCTAVRRIAVLTVMVLLSDLALPCETPAQERIQVPVGVDSNLEAIWASVPDSDNVLDTQQRRVLLVGDGGEVAASQVRRLLTTWQEESSSTNALLSVSAIPDPRIDLAAQRFPPEGRAYETSGPCAAHYLWRWIGMFAPDVVIVISPSERFTWWIGSDGISFPLAQTVRFALRSEPRDCRELSAQLSTMLPQLRPSGIGEVPAMRAGLPHDDESQLLRVLEAIAKSDLQSKARKELLRRAARDPVEIARQLSRGCGRELPAVEYIPAMALVGRLRLERIDPMSTALQDVLALAKPYLAGNQPSELKSGSAIAGHLLFAELAQLTPPRDASDWLGLARRAADAGFDSQGIFGEAMPFHLEMSDAYFMGGPILASVGRLTGEAKYFDACERHLLFMEQLVLRPDGLLRHSPLDETAWARGNGFAALGLASCISQWPELRADRLTLVARHRELLRHLLKHQDRNGMWHQVVDHSESYAELSSTCMIGWSMLEGLRRGWLERSEFEIPVQMAWSGIRLRIGFDGQLIDVCTGTGKQTSLRQYFDREAILGTDPRGAAMALLMAVQMAEWERERE